MIQRKGNCLWQMAEAQTRGTRKIWMFREHGQGAMALQPWGSFLPQLRELEEVSPNWSLHPEPTREPHSVEDKSLPGQGNTFCEDFQQE